MLDFDALTFSVIKYDPVRNDAGEIIDYEVVYQNAAAKKYGTVRHLGTRLFDHVPEARNTEHDVHLKRVINSKKSFTYAHKTVHGPLKDIDIYHTLIPHEDGCIVSFQDLTKLLKENSDDSVKSKSLHLASERSVHGLAFLTATGDFTYVNPSICKTLGYSAEEIIGKNLNSFMHPEDFASDIKISQRMISGEIEEDIRDKRLLHKDGHEILVSVALSIGRHKNSDDISFIAQLRDVREEREKSRQLKTALMQAEEATTLKSEFLANMSHEIRTPLNGVIGMAQVLAYGDLTPKQGEQVATILDSGQTLMSILNDILDLSKIEQGHLDISVVDTDLRHKLKRSEKIQRIAADEKGVNLQYFFHPSVPARLNLDPVRVRQCVDNLVANAIKFTDRGDVMVVVSASPVDGDSHKITIHVSDSGVGIEADALGKVFESFRQADGSITRRFGGTGLGLPISRKLARLMGGDLTVVSVPDEGSVFTLTFTAQSSQSAIVETPDIMPAELMDPPPQPGLSGANILVVDDNAINREVARSLLELYTMNVLEAIDGADAIKMMDKIRFDAVLMDVHMPVVDGVAALKHVRSGQGPNTDTAIFALTADAMTGDREKYLALGFTDYIAKPFSERDLISMIEKELSQPVTRRRKSKHASP